MNIEEMKNKIKPLNLIIKYKCKKCNKIMKSFTNYKYHIQNDVCNKINKLECKKCNKIFTDKRSLKYHIANNVCETIIKNITNKTTNKTINMTNNNIQTQNNQNQIININLSNPNDIQKVVNMIPFKNVKYNITTEKYLEYARYPERAIKSFVKDEHFNPNKPERMNIFNSNSRSNKVQVLDRDEDDKIKWMIKSKTDINELLYDRGVNHLYVAKNILEANGIFLDIRTEQRLNDKINEYETDNRSKREQIDIISDLTYNYRDIIDSNKKINKLLLQN